MMKFLQSIFLLVFILYSSLLQAQQLKGRVIDEGTEEPLAQVTITVLSNSFTAVTDANGYFIFDQKLPLGNQKIQFVLSDFLTKVIPVVITADGLVNLDPVYMQLDVIEEQQNAGIISLTENDLAQDSNASTNISGLLQAVRDQFLRAAAFDFSTTFFRPRGLDGEDGKVLINGIEMNKLFTGRPQFSNWGGLNDQTRSQVYSLGLAPAEQSFGGFAGVQSINMRAVAQRQGTNIAYSASNRTFTGRVIATYSSGLRSGGWAYSVSASRRAGDEGFVEGTPYDANSLGLLIGKRFGANHALNFTGIYAKNRRGRNAPLSEEVRNLKGIAYNPNWGFVGTEVRNSRIREINEPLFILSHDWKVNEKIAVNSNVSYQFGKIGNTRIDNGGTRLVVLGDQEAYLGGARNPNPDYYQNLPSFYLRNGSDPIDFQNAYIAQQDLINDGQLDWEAIYLGNQITRASGGNSIYAIQEDRTDDKTIVANSFITADLTDKIRFNGGVSYRKLFSENYAKLQDLLGGTGYLDVDFFAEESAAALVSAQVLAQSDVNNPNRIVNEGERYKYNYELDAEVASAFAQAQFKTSKVDFFVSGQVANTTYQRNGLYENGNFAGNQSFGKSQKLDFLNYGVKGGATFKVSGKTFFDLNAAYVTDAPNLNVAFPNARQTNQTVEGLESQTSYSGDISYIYKSPIVKARLTGYFSEFNNGTDLGFYFTENLTGLPSDNGSAFVQEVTTNIDRRNMGLEMGLEIQVTPTINLKSALALGTNRYINNPNLYLTSDDFAAPLRFGDGTTSLDSYHVSGGPETALQFGFEYRDPDFWNVGVTWNYFANAYADINKLSRSANFSQDFDGQTFTDYDPVLARQLLKQQQFDNYTIVNIIGGKSWRINAKTVGFFANINNVLNTEFRTGGFEQGRNSNFRSIRDDKANPTEVFASRYFYGNGATYNLNVYLRF